MGRLLFFMFATLIMALILFMAVYDFLSRKKISKKENRETFEKDIDDLANKIKNKQ